MDGALRSHAHLIILGILVFGECLFCTYFSMILSEFAISESMM